MATTTTKLCRWCKQINFEAILTPRTWDEDTGRMVAPLRPEYSGNGRSPSLQWTHFGKTNRTGPPDGYLPQIRTARYDELSDSDSDADLGPPQNKPSEGRQGIRDEGEQGCPLNDLDDVGSESGSEGSDDESVSTWSNNSHYTEIQRIDLEKQAQGNWDYRHGHLYYLGSIWDVRSRRRECDLCRSLWRITCAYPAVKSEYLTNSQCILKLMNMDARRSDQPDKAVCVLNLLYMFGYKLGDPRQGGWEVKFSTVIQGQHRDVCELREQTTRDQVIPFQDRLFGEARPRADVCDFRLFRDWLKTCETKHNHPNPDLAGNMTIRLIEVRQKCLVHWQGPTSEAPRFVALSYMWGKDKQTVVLYKDRLSEFEKPGFLIQNLDRTIQDAIEVVARIGETFIWVDALCILQDSPEDKRVQIPQMHHIYSKAVLVIVAAHGNSAGAGLPGVAPKSRKVPRVLLDLVRGNPLGVRHDGLHRLEGAYDYTYRDEEKPEPSRNSYATLIKNYLERNLTHDTDILDACSGVLSKIRETEQTDFFFGLRTKLFGNDLLFNYNSHAARRFPDQDKPGAGTRAKFPTWSWTAWKGSVEIANVARNNSHDPVENLVPCDGVKCYRMRVGQHGKKSLEVINEDGGWRFEEGYVRSSEGIFDPTELGNPEPHAQFHGESGGAETTTTTADSSAVDIPPYSQDLTLLSLSHHSAYPHVLPDFHVVFATFSCLVVVRTQAYKEERRKHIPGLVFRSWGRREVYACRRKSLGTEPETTSQDVPGTDVGESSIPRPLPRSLQQGPYLSYLPPTRTYEELLAIRDGVYRLLFMNNNQLPMWGHLLCKPKSSSALEDGSN
ncbi:ankyrin unc44 [Fusarium albosuccineum]|uniref:Ankyrin unc44 n=1 Tax=Fusarium albosuccineum TaxID=1237068 RepID=A0A8H4PCN8_9HYPO|nr:ankyrin unc44 [Fusarium albosuccineum]